MSRNSPQPCLGFPYFKYLKREGRDIGQADFARLQRESLENYLLDLIRAVVSLSASRYSACKSLFQMFHPSANRLATFLEINALSISLAPSGGAQYKAGILHIESNASNGGGGLGRKSVSWRARKEPKWCVARESYLAVMEEPGDVSGCL
jgi:phospholipase D1/2